MTLLPICAMDFTILWKIQSVEWLIAYIQQLFDCFSLTLKGLIILYVCFIYLLVVLCIVSRLQAIDSIHQVGLYCLALVPANTLPKTPLGGIHISDTKQLFLEGALHPCNILMCPHTCVTNMPKPRQKQPGVYVGIKWRSWR